MKWLWDFGDNGTDSVQQNPLHEYRDTGIYYVTLIITSPLGCLDTVIHPVDIDPDFSFFIPNTFTPNNDGKNETFNGFGIGILKYEMNIFDRWGDLIFKTTDYSKPWKGTANNGSQLAQQDTYVYVFNITDVLNRKHRFIGHVNLVK